jgi:two-component system, LuxR family, sensor kinase FixL
MIDAEPPAADTRELRGRMRDIVALSTLPASWINYAPPQIAGAMAEAVLPMLGCELVFVLVAAKSDESQIRVMRTASAVDPRSAERIGAALVDWLATRLSEEAAKQFSLGHSIINMFSMPIGIPGDAALAAGSVRSNFPTEAERLLLRVAANETATCLLRCRAQSDERRFAALLQHSSDFIGFSTLDGVPFYLNPAGRELVGLDEAADLRHLHMLDFVALEDRAWFRDEILPLTMQQGRWVGEMRFRNFKSGADIPILNEWFLIDGFEAGRPTRMATVSRDLSARKRSEEELRDMNETLEHRVADRTRELASANRMLSDEKMERKRTDTRLQELQSELYHAGRVSAAGQMAAALAHELSQPMSAIANSLGAGRRLIAAKSINIDMVQEVMDEATSQVVRAGQIIRRLRAFVSRGDVVRGVESIMTMIEDARALALANSETLGVTVRFHFDPNALHAFADRIQIQLVITNLLRNALDALTHSDSRELSITTSLIDRATIEIAVADTGSGLSKEAEANLFEPFVSTKRDGMGLGLSLSRSIVEAHGGSLRYEPNPGGGAIFRFTLPAAPTGHSSVN